MRCAYFFLSVFFAVATGAAHSTSLDFKLEQIKRVYQIKACTPSAKGKLYSFGKFLFNTKTISGDRDTSCATCHLPKNGMADGLPLAVGVGGHGEGLSRLYDGRGTIVSRNAISLIGRGNLVTKNFFWDGKVDSDVAGNFFSPFGSEISNQFLTALSIAATLPLTERDEFLGKTSLIAENELIYSAAGTLYADRYKALKEPIKKRLIEEERSLKDSQAWTIVAANDFELAHLGNALAEFITAEFGCPDSAWEKYLRGDHRAIDNAAKQGAVLFFGKARCATCHTPPSFSDGKFHSLGVPQLNFGPSSRSRDLGRASVTNKAIDLYKFRTPPLLALSATGPYGHNGIFKTIEDVVLHHVNPTTIFFTNLNLNESQNRLRSAKAIDTRSDKLRRIEIESEAELRDIVAFLKTL